MAVRRSCRFRLLVRPASRWRLLPLCRLIFPVAVRFIRLATPLFVLACLGMAVVLEKRRNPRTRMPGFRLIFFGTNSVWKIACPVRGNQPPPDLGASMAVMLFPSMFGGFSSLEMSFSFSSMFCITR